MGVGLPLAIGNVLYAARFHREGPSLVEDDRDALHTAGPILLVVEEVESLAAKIRDLSYEMGFQCLVAETGDEALVLARQFKPIAVVLGMGLSDHSALAVFDRLKRYVETQHIPVHVLPSRHHVQAALSKGKISYLARPIKRRALTIVLEELAAKLERTSRLVLIVEDDPVQLEAVKRCLTSGNVETVSAGTAAECLQRLQERVFDCIVLDFALPDASGQAALETISKNGSHSFAVSGASAAH